MKASLPNLLDCGSIQRYIVSDMDWCASDFGDFAVPSVPGKSSGVTRNGAAVGKTNRTQELHEGESAPLPVRPSTSRTNKDDDDEDCVVLGVTVGRKRSLSTNTKPKRLKVGSSTLSALEEYRAKQKAEERKNRDLWVDKYKPKTKADLAINKKKLNDIEAWMKGLQAGTTRRILVLTGISGCGKSTAVRVLAGDLGVSVADLENPDGTPYDPDDKSSYESKLGLLEHFLCASKYGPTCWEGPPQAAAANTPRKSSVALIEEIPAFCLQDPKKLHSLLRRFCVRGTTGVVFIVTENNVGNARFWTLFPADVIASLGITVIKFNPMTTTALTKHFTAVAKKELTGAAPSSGEITELIESCRGDIRAGLTALEFSVASSTHGKKSRGPKERLAFGRENADRDQTIALFRAIGRIFYVKRNIGEPFNKLGLPVHLIQEARRPLTYAPENIIEKCCTSAETYVAFLHENYPRFIGELDFLERAADCFSLADHMMSAWTSENRVAEVAGSMAVRGLLQLQPAETATKFRSMVKPGATEARKTMEARKVRGQAVITELMPSVSAFKMYSEVFPYWGKMASANGVFGSYLREISTLSDCSYTIRETLEEDEWCETATGTPPDTSEPPMEQVIDELNLQFSDIFTDNDRDDFSDSRNTQNLVASGNPYDTSQISIEEIDN